MNYQGIESRINPENERDAIVDFLSKNWDIQSTKPLPEIVQFVLNKGIEYGIAYKEMEFVNASDTLHGLLRFMKFSKSTRISELNIESHLNKLNAKTKKIILAAEPKGYSTYSISDTNKKSDYSGAKLCNEVASMAPPLEKTLSNSSIYFNEQAKNKKPTAELIDAIFRQGMNIGITAVEQKYGTLAHAAREYMRYQLTGKTKK